MSRNLASAGLGLALIVALAAPARADEPAVAGTGTGRVYGSSTTILMMREVLDPRDPASVLYQAPFYEYITLGGDDLGTPGFSFHVTDVPSAERPPFSLVGISAASLGLRLPSPSHAASGS